MPCLCLQMVTQYTSCMCYGEGGLAGASTITGLAGPSKGAAKLRDRGNRVEAR